MIWNRLLLPSVLFAGLLALPMLTASGQRYWRGDPYGGGYHASTAAEGAARGSADLVRSSGAANYMNSEAAINMTEAASRQMDNQVKYAETYFEKRQINESYRDSQRRPPPTSEQVFRWGKERAPKRLSVSELDPVSGQVQWPPLLTEDNFAPYRATIEKQFDDAAANGGTITSTAYREIRAATDAMQDELKANIRDYPPNQFSTAQKFLRSLAYEASSPPAA